MQMMKDEARVPIRVRPETPFWQRGWRRGATNDYRASAEMVAFEKSKHNHGYQTVHPVKLLLRSVGRSVTTIA